MRIIPRTSTGHAEQDGQYVYHVPGGDREATSIHTGIHRAELQKIEGFNGCLMRPDEADVARIRADEREHQIDGFIDDDDVADGPI